MRLVLIFVLLTQSIAACSLTGREDRVAFDGVFFNAKAANVDEDLSVFQIAVSPASASLDGAREAGRFEATKYCIKKFGLSDATWTNGPDDTPESLIIQDDNLILNGSCDG